ncbi:MAG: nucleotidyltransferase domain-containing protein [Deltaproteobacteria bacterium]|nr:nucleotidyltransferase domain-containing protein [Deltaproteobacteria bacterium]
MLEKERKEQIEGLKQNLETLLGPHTFKMLLFGSRARGDYCDASDFDVAIVVRGLTREMKQLVLEKVAESELTYLLPLSALVLSEEDFGVLRQRERRIAMDIEREGIPL